MAKEAIKFDFSTLPKLSREAVTLLNTCVKLEIGKDIEPFLDNVAKQLSSISQLEASLRLRGLSTENSRDTRSTQAESSVNIVCTIPPISGHFFVQIDRDICRQIIYRAIGGKEAFEQTANPLTSVEKGILSFVVLKLLKGTQAQLHLPGQLQLLGFEHNFDANYLICDFSFALNGSDSFVRLGLSDTLLDSLSLPKTTQITAALPRVENLRVPFLTQVGQINLAPKELSALEVDDIIVLDSKGLQLKDGLLEGVVSFGLDSPLLAKGSSQLLVAKNGRYAVQISDISLSKEPVAREA